jgi:hypothetical protein
MKDFKSLVDDIAKLTGPRCRGDEFYSLYRLCLRLHDNDAARAKDELLNFLQGRYPADLIKLSEALVSGEGVSNTIGSAPSEKRFISKEINSA